MESAGQSCHIVGMANKTKKPMTDAEQNAEAVAGWDNEGGAPPPAARMTTIVVDIATGELDQPTATKLTKRASNAGAKGGATRAKALTLQRKSEIASAAAAARWKKS